TNALRYGGGKPVAIEVAPTADGRARMSVQDHGIGIAPQDQARIFEQFERTDDSRRHAAGLGLGLFITREIVRAHGGAITVASTPGEGSRFEVALPTRPPAEPVTAPMPQPIVPAART
ncbi:MAG TPA: HAMP domain-containing sensor histidine kinase, partial [Variovorax sp.]|nr:HAMP domain-containing sensor histidine kinase [Variovorax sp.]